MKKVYFPLITLFSLLLLSATSFAQSNGGFRLGLSSSNIMLEDEDGKVDSDEQKSLLGFHIGFLYDYTFENGLAIETGIIGTTRGFKAEYELLGSDITSRIALFYFDVPVNLMYKLKLDPLTIFAQAGPYVGVGMAGVSHTRAEFNGDVEEDSQKIEFGTDDESFLKRGELGLQFGGGIQISSFLIGVYYQLGLKNVVPAEDPGDMSMKHRMLQVSIGAKLGSK